MFGWCFDMTSVSWGVICGMILWAHKKRWLELLRAITTHTRAARRPSPVRPAAGSHRQPRTQSTRHGYFTESQIIEHPRQPRGQALIEVDIIEAGGPGQMGGAPCLCTPLRPGLMAGELQREMVAGWVGEGRGRPLLWSTLENVTQGAARRIKKDL